MDFSQQTGEARQDLDKWMGVETNHAMSEGAGPSQDSGTALVLANTIRFLGIWQWQFAEHQIKPAPFRMATGDSVDADMMHQTWTFNNAEGETLQALELPFKAGPGRCGDWVMLFVLPRSVDGLNVLERHFERTGLKEWTELRPHEVDVKVPRFRVEEERDLLPCLSRMGISHALSTEEAHFSAMVDSPVGTFLGAALHKAFIEVNEKGTEAGPRPSCSCF